MVGYSLFQIM